MKIVLSYSFAFMLVLTLGIFIGLTIEGSRKTQAVTVLELRAEQTRMKVLVDSIAIETGVNRAEWESLRDKAITRNKQPRRK